MFMYSDGSLSSFERRRLHAFLGERKRLERIERNIMIKQIIDQEKERVLVLRKAMEDRKRKDIEERMNDAASRI